jgi:hypothetical protein
VLRDTVFWDTTIICRKATHAWAGWRHAGHSESAGTNALAVAQKALGIKGPLQGDLTKTEAGAALASAATKAADVGVHSVERSLAALKTYNEMSATQRTAGLRMQSWRARGVVDAEMEQVRESGPGGLTREVETPLPANSPHDHLILRVDLVDSHGRWKRPCMQTAHMTI